MVEYLLETFPSLRTLSETKIRDVVKKVSDKKEEFRLACIREKKDFIQRCQLFYEDEKKFYLDKSYREIAAYLSSREILEEFKPSTSRPYHLWDYPRFAVYTAAHFVYPRTQEHFPYLPYRFSYWDRFCHSVKTYWLYFYKSPCPYAIIGGIGTGLMFGTTLGLIRFKIKKGHVKTAKAPGIKKIPGFYSISPVKLMTFIRSAGKILGPSRYFMVIFGAGGLLFGCYNIQPDYNKYNIIWDDIRYIAIGPAAPPVEMWNDFYEKDYTEESIELTHNTLALRAVSIMDLYKRIQLKREKASEIDKVEEEKKRIQRRRWLDERSKAMNHFSTLIDKDGSK